MKARLIYIAVLAAFLAPQPVLPQANTGNQIYGSQLMTTQERDQYRERMRAATTDEERERIRAEHHERMNERAKAHGFSLPDQPRVEATARGPALAAAWAQVRAVVGTVAVAAGAEAVAVVEAEAGARMNDTHTFSVELEQREGFDFRVTFDWPGIPELALDEPEPLGKRRGPNAARLVAAAVANCLAASMVFCLKNKFRQNPGPGARWRPGGSSATNTGATGSPASTSCCHSPRSSATCPTRSAAWSNSKTSAS